SANALFLANVGSALEDSPRLAPRGRELPGCRVLVELGPYREPDRTRLLLRDVLKGRKQRQGGREGKEHCHAEPQADGENVEGFGELEHGGRNPVGTGEREGNLKSELRRRATAESGEYAVLSTQHTAFGTTYGALTEY